MSEHAVLLRKEAQGHLYFICYDDGSARFEWWEEEATPPWSFHVKALRQLVLSAEEMEIVRTSVPPQGRGTPRPFPMSLQGKTP
jgi:hypothetical protein